MRSTLFIFLFLSLFLVSCEEDIIYLGEFELQYSLNCILRSDRDTQYATLKRSYHPDEVNPDTDIQNAIIKLHLSDTTFTFKDSVLSDNTSGTQKISYFYFIKNFQLEKGTEVNIEALLPDGTILSSETISPYFYRLSLLEEGGGPMIIPTENLGDKYYYKWKINGNFEHYIFGPSFYVRYYLSGDEANIQYKKVVGRYYQQLNSYEVPVASIDKAMQEISTDVEDKTTINIIGACFEVKVYDTALGIYATSTQTFEDEFSIRLSEPNISNIKGGLGIFGSYISEKFNIAITTDYIISFGFTPVSEM